MCPPVAAYSSRRLAGIHRNVGEDLDDLGVQSGGSGDEAALGEGPRAALGVGDDGAGLGCDQASGEQVGLLVT